MQATHVDFQKIARMAKANRSDIADQFPNLRRHVRQIVEDDPRLYHFVLNLIEAQEMPDALLEELFNFVRLLRDGTISLRDWLNDIEVD